MRKDFEYLDVPGHLETKAFNVKKSGEKVRDDDWYRRTEEWTGAIVDFFRDNDLFIDPGKFADVPNREAIIRMSDLVDDAYDFVMALEIEKWLGSLDRRRAKDPTADVRADLLQKRWERFLVKNPNA